MNSGFAGGGAGAESDGCADPSGEDTGVVGIAGELVPRSNWWKKSLVSLSPDASDSAADAEFAGAEFVCDTSALDVGNPEGGDIITGVGAATVPPELTPGVASDGRRYTGALGT
jgi:hypothetical protein